VDTCQESSGIVRILLGNGQRQAVDIIDPSLSFQEWGSGGRWFKSSRPDQEKKKNETVELAKLT
jgi:hypothetical protein